MNDPYHILIAQERDFLTLLANRLDHLAASISVNTPVVEMAAMVVARRQELADLSQMGNGQG